MSTSKKSLLTKEEISHVCNLANLPESEEEKEKYKTQLSNVVDYINKLSALTVDSVERASQTTGLENVFREDEIKPSLSQKEALSNAKKSYNGFFMVKAIFEE